MNEIIQAITTVGFPIVMCLIACFYIKYILDANREQINTMNAEHKAEVSEMTKAIENNTLALTKLIEKLDN